MRCPICGSNSFTSKANGCDECSFCGFELLSKDGKDLLLCSETDIAQYQKALKNKRKSFQSATSDEKFEIDADGTLLKYHGGGIVVIPSRVKKIGDEAFLDATSVQKVFIPKSVTSIGTISESARYQGAFGHCYLLEHIVFQPESNCHIIGNGAFFNVGCQADKLVIDNFPVGLSAVGEYAFNGANCAGALIAHFGEEQAKKLLKGASWKK